MPLTTVGKNEVFVGRIRRDLVNERGLHLWMVADNLRKGAATNTVQIAQYLLERERWACRLVSIACALSCVANGSRSHHNQVFLRCAKRSDSFWAAPC